jgi:hypothetical protein
MEVRVSPSVVIVVLVLVASILLGLYFIVVSKPVPDATADAAMAAPSSPGKPVVADTKPALAADKAAGATASKPVKATEASTGAGPASIVPPAKPEAPSPSQR